MPPSSMRLLSSGVLSFLALLTGCGDEFDSASGMGGAAGVAGEAPFGSGGARSGAGGTIAAGGSSGGPALGGRAGAPSGGGGSGSGSLGGTTGNDAGSGSGARPGTGGETISGRGGTGPSGDAGAAGSVEQTGGSSAGGVSAGGGAAGGISAGGSAAGGAGGSGGASGAGAEAGNGQGTAGDGYGGTGGGSAGSPGAGGAGAGGAPAGGAAGNGTAAGGVGQAGAAGAAGAVEPPSYPFESAPCVALEPTDQGIANVYAKGSDLNIYALSASETTAGTWTLVDGLDGSILDRGANADLDCSTTPLPSGTDQTYKTAMTALGGMPQGRILRAFGGGTLFSAFEHIVTETALDTAPSVSAWNDANIHVAGSMPSGTTPRGILLWLFNDPSFPSNRQNLATPDTITTSLASGVDTSLYALGSTFLTRLVAITTDNRLQYITYDAGAIQGWNTPQYFGPPANTTLQHSPATCGNYNAGQFLRSYMVVTADDQLWYTVSESGVFGAWQRLSDVEVVSAPDCVFVSLSGSAHFVALTAEGTILHVLRDWDGNVTETDLGEYPAP